MLDAILPNIDIFKSPSNWFLVAFAVAILAMIFHILFKDSAHNGQ